VDVTSELARLREKEAQLRAIIEHEPECVNVLDAHGRLVEMNPAGLAMFGAGNLEAVAGTCLYPLVVPEHRDAFRALTERVCRGEAGGTMRFEIVGLNGRRRWLETKVTPLRGEAQGEHCLLGVTRDITARVDSERRTQDADARSREAVEHLIEPICITDADDRIVVANRSFRELNAAVAECIAPGRSYEDHLRAGIALGLFPDAEGRAEAWLEERMARRRARCGARTAAGC